jgi:hypothetical protein
MVDNIDSEPNSDASGGPHQPNRRGLFTRLLSRLHTELVAYKQRTHSETFSNYLCTNACGPGHRAARAPDVAAIPRLPGVSTALRESWIPTATALAERTDGRQFAGPGAEDDLNVRNRIESIPSQPKGS